MDTDVKSEAESEADHAYLGHGWIRTQYGTFSMEAPTFDIKDIAHALALCNRYNGHTNFPISVAEHSVTVARIVTINKGTREECREGLMHDATEAYMSDIPAPFKQYLPDWKEHDKRLEGLMRRQFNLPPAKSEIVAVADWYSLFIEANAALPGNGEDFEDPLGYRKEALLLAEEYPVLVPNGGQTWEEHRAMFVSIATMYGLVPHVTS